MPESARSSIEEIIRQNHGGDEKQLEIIMSPHKRIVIEAPAGCGKTTTMVSKIAYMIANDVVPHNKKILTLTFSVNAAYKVKKDISEKLPLLGLEKIGSPEDLNNLIYISNYHGLCRRILSLYGYLIDSRLKDINDFKAINENDYRADETFSEYGLDINDYDKEVFSSFHEAVLDCDESRTQALGRQYCEIIKEKFLSKKYITYNAYLLLTKVLFSENTSLLQFYQKLYPTIIIDEFQDTNYLSWSLICLLVGEETRCFFMGDSLQRIYGFIGAIPNLLDIAKETFGMEKIEMVKNYRFQNNPEMLLLDRNIRANARNIINPTISSNAVIDLHYSKTQSEESAWVVEKITEVQNNNDSKSIAILVQQRGPGIDDIIKTLDENNIDFFFALFSDEDDEYISFHRRTLAIFYQVLRESKYGRVNKTLLNIVCRTLKMEYSRENRLTEALLMLVNVFFDRICTEYRFLDNQDKIAFIVDTFENRALKQNMDLIDSKLFISTVHGAKGLEWDFIFIPDLEPYCFPNYPSLCGECNTNGAKSEKELMCYLNKNRISESKLLEELSVFYVAVTRAKEKLFFSASGKRTNAKGRVMDSKISCMASLSGIIVNMI